MHTAVCSGNLDFMQGYEDGTYRLIVTSPPCNIGKSYELRSGLGNYLEGQERVVAECVRLLADDGPICWQVGSKTDLMIFSELKKITKFGVQSHTLKN